MCKAGFLLQIHHANVMLYLFVTNSQVIHNKHESFGLTDLIRLKDEGGVLKDWQNIFLIQLECNDPKTSIVWLKV